MGWTRLIDGTFRLLKAKEVLVAEERLVSKLKTEHAGLELAIENEMARRHPDEKSLRELKRQKLRIKDALLRRHAA
jgi:hypothetical protein